MDSLGKLKKLVELMPDHTPGEKSGCMLELQSKVGIGFAMGLLKNPKVAVANVIVSKGAEFVPHFHPEMEMVIVYEGQMKIEILDEQLEPVRTLLLESGDYFVFPSMTPHNSRAIEDSRAIAITIPASEGFPEGFPVNT